METNATSNRPAPILTIFLDSETVCRKKN